MRAFECREYGARLSLALQRTRRFLRWWLGVGGVATVIALLLPVATQAPITALTETATRAAADSVASADRLQRAMGRAAAADSLAMAELERLRTPEPVRPARRVPAASASLAEAIARAEESRAMDAVLAENAELRTENEQLVAEHRMGLADARELIADVTGRLARESFRL
jgi:hypothetical protein